MINSEKRQIVLANKIPFPRIIHCPDKKGVVRCPFPENHEHGDIHKSAFYYKDTNLVHCYTFHKTWSPVLFVVEKLGCDKLEAAKLLLKKFGNSEVVYSKPKPQISFNDLKKQKWADLVESFSYEPRFVGIVYFIEEMESVAKETDLEIFNLAQIDAFRIKALIEERSCDG